MVNFVATVEQFTSQGEKTRWTYIRVPAAIAQKLKPGNKKGFRVKGKLDDFPIDMIAVLPMGDGSFIMAINAAMRKGTGKRKGAKLKVQIELDLKIIKPPAELMQCLEDEPKAMTFFKTLTKSHQNYFGNWVRSAKTNITRDKRIAYCVTALSKKYDFGKMLREIQQKRKDLDE